MERDGGTSTPTYPQQEIRSGFTFPPKLLNRDFKTTDNEAADAPSTGGVT